MTIDDIEWLLRYPCDEMVMSRETVNKISTLIANAGRIAEGIQYVTTYGVDQRQVKTPTSLAGRKLTIMDIPDASSTDSVSLRVKGVDKVCVAFD